VTPEQQAIIERVAEALYSYDTGRSDWQTGSEWVSEPVRLHWRRMAATALTAAQGPIYRHLKSGTVYERLGEAEGQLAKPDFHYESMGNVPRKGYRHVSEGTVITVYRGEGGKLWWRFPDEFDDGRFEKVEG
jgi:hypothetical protein